MDSLQQIKKKNPKTQNQAVASKPWSPSESTSSDHHRNVLCCQALVAY